MAKKLITGANWDDLTEVLATAIRELRVRDKGIASVAIAAPSHLARQWVLRRLAVFLDNDLAGIHVLTLNQLAHEALIASEREAPVIIEDKRYISLVWELLSKDKGGYSFPALDPYPTVRALYGALREMRDAAVGLDEARWLATQEPWEGLQAGEAGRAVHLFRLYGRYLEALSQRGWHDSSSLLEAAASECRLPWPLHIWGFMEFTGSQMLFLESLVRSEGDFTVYLPEGEFTKPFTDQLKGWGFILGNPVQSPLATRRSRLISCPTPQEEAWVAAKMVRNLIRTGKAFSWECAVIVRDKDTYMPALARFMDENAIPWVCAQDPQLSLSQLPSGRVLAAALEYWRKPSPAGLDRLIEQPGSRLDPAVAQATRHLLARFLSLTPRCRLRLGRRKGSLSRGIRGTRSTLTSMFERLFKEQGGPKTAPHEVVVLETARWAEACLKAEEAGPRNLWRWIESVLAVPKGPSPQAQAWERLRDMILNLPALVAKSRPMTASLVLEMAGSLTIEPERGLTRASGVWILGTHEARGGQWRHVFLCGATDTAFPLDVPEDPFLRPAVRRRLNALGISTRDRRRPRRTQGAPSPVYSTGQGGSRFKVAEDRIWAEDEMLFRLLKAGAGEDFTAAWPKNSNNGNPSLPSPFLEDIKEFWNLPSTLMSDRFEFLKRLAGSPEGAAALLTQEEHGGLSRAASQSAKKLPLAISTRVTAESWQKWAAGGRRLSPSLVADFISCPHAFWWKSSARVPDLISSPRNEFFPAPFLGNAFSESCVKFLNALRPAPCATPGTLAHSSLRRIRVQDSSSGAAQRASRSLVRLWRRELALAFPDITAQDCGAAERYKLARIEQALERLAGNLNESGFWSNAQIWKKEQDIEFTLENVLSYECRVPSSEPNTQHSQGSLSPLQLPCRVDALGSSGGHVEFKLTTKSVFGETTAKRTGPEALLRKLLDPSKPEGGRYGLQVLYYAAHALEKAVVKEREQAAFSVREKVLSNECRVPGAELSTPHPAPGTQYPKSSQSPVVWMINPYWEVPSAVRSPMIYAWNPKELQLLFPPMSGWAQIFAQGLINGSEAIFPFRPHLGFGKRCGYCAYRLMCLKDNPEAAKAHEAGRRPLESAQEDEEANEG